MFANSNYQCTEAILTEHVVIPKEFMLSNCGYLDGFGGHCGSSLHHAVSNAQRVSVLEEWCDEGDILGTTPRLKQIQRPALCVPPDIVQDQVKP